MKNIFEIKSLWDGLVAWYRFDEKLGGKIFDHSVNPNHGVVHGAVPSFPGWKFNGSSDYVNCGNDASLNITDAITIEAWVKLASTQVNYARILDRANSGGITEGWRVKFSSGLLYRFEWWNGVSISQIALTFPSADVWHHLVFTHNGTIAYAYMNGNIVDTLTANLDISTSIDLYIGNLAAANIPFNGAIGEIRIYNREISTNEVLALFNGTKKFYF